MSVAAADLNRIVQLVAELSRDPEANAAGASLDAVAARLGTTPHQVQQDLRTLTAISDDVGAEWLGSLSVWQEGDRVAVVSRGPYRRPIRFTPDELLAIRVGLAMERPGGEALAQRIGAALDREAVPGRHPGVHVDVAAGDGEARVVALAREAIKARRVMTLLYAGERDLAGAARQVEPCEVVAVDGRSYIVAWCRRAHGWRHFRADRVLYASLEAETFAARADFEALRSPSDVFRAADHGDEVVVRYSPQVARWLAERFPNARRLESGAVEVTHRVVEPAWLVRMVLQYGAEAEVVGPAPYREYVARAVGAP